VGHVDFDIPKEFHVYVPNTRFFLPNIMEPISSREAASRLATHEFPNILYNPNVHYRVARPSR
jgi:hypothetical protein